MPPVPNRCRPPAPRLACQNLLAHCFHRPHRSRCPHRSPAGPAAARKSPVYAARCTAEHPAAQDIFHLYPPAVIACGWPPRPPAPDPPEKIAVHSHLRYLLTKSIQLCAVDRRCCVAGGVPHCIAAQVDSHFSWDRLLALLQRCLPGIPRQLPARYLHLRVAQAVDLRSGPRSGSPRSHCRTGRRRWRCTAPPAGKPAIVRRPRSPSHSAAAPP